MPIPRRDYHEVFVCPEIGATIAAFRSEIDDGVVDLLRPAGPAGAALIADLSRSPTYSP